MQPTQDAPHALYRFYGFDGALLYVGITCDVGARWTKHAKDKPWWTEVARTTIEHYPNRQAVLDAEKNAIKAERPKYNVQHNKKGEVQPPPEVGMSTGVLREGDVVAIGTTSGECPVGMITALDEFGVRLAQLNWIVGCFADPRVVLHHEIVEIRHAPQTDDTEFDCVQLGRFQSRYEDAHLPKFLCPECDEWKKITKRASLGECVWCEDQIRCGRPRKALIA